MPITFNDSNQHVDTTTIPVSAFPFSVSAHVQIPDTVAAHIWFQFGLDGSNTYRFQGYTDSSGLPTINHNDTGGGETATSASISINLPYVLGGAFVSNSKRYSVRNGVVSTHNNVPQSDIWANVDTLSHGATTVPSLYAGHKMAHWAVWDIELSQADWTALGTGISPLQVRPESLVSYRPFWDSSIDLIAGNTLTEYNSPTYEADGFSRLYLPHRGEQVLPFAAAGTPSPLVQYTVPGLSVTNP
jgi:hypothetical protein